MKNKPTVEKWEEILKKAEKYVRGNAVYYGNDQYRLSMTDWLYFIKGVASEIEAHSVQEAKAERDREILQWLQDEGEISEYDKERLLASLKQEEV